MLNVAEMTPAGGGGGTLPANLVTGTSQSTNLAFWSGTNVITGYGGLTFSPGSGLGLTGDMGMSGNLGVGNGITISGGNLHIHSWFGLLSATNGIVSQVLAVPNQFGYGETQWASNGGAIGTISAAVNTPPLNGITGTLGGTITLPTGSFQGQILLIKDEGGNALSANIIVAGTIDGGTNFVINQDYGSVTVYWDAVTTQWFTI